MLMGSALCLVRLASPTQAAAAERMGCSPQTLTPDSTLTLSLPWPHGGKLHIEGPKPEEIYYTVIMYDNPKTVGFRPIIKGQIFEYMRRLSLQVPKILGDDLDPEQMSRPRRKPQRVFTISGDYKVYIEAGPSANIWVTICTVHYVDPSFKGPGPKRRYTPGVYDEAE
jgi:hypothetical protein